MESFVKYQKEVEERFKKDEKERWKKEYKLEEKRRQEKQHEIRMMQSWGRCLVAIATIQYHMMTQTTIIEHLNTST